MENCNSEFDQIRPFNDAEVHKVIEELCNEPYFIRILPFIFPKTPTDKLIDKLRSITTVESFQTELVIPFLDNLIKTTTRGVTADGLEHIIKGKSYLFMSNHRDIILDSAFLNFKLNEHGIDTTEIAIGDNLLIYDWITDLVKLNKSFVVKRNLPVRQMMEASGTLSAFIRDSIVNRHQSIWIAQREGRSKDGDDQTQGSVLKMLNLSGKEEAVDNFKELQIVPVSISYEFDPCDYLKAYQFQLKRDDPSYQKTKNDDLEHMNTGLRGQKGRVHFSFGTPLSTELEGISGLNKNAQIQAIADMVDHQIHLNYHLWPDNYAAYDLLNNTQKFVDKYTDAEKKEFLDYITEHISRLDECDKDFVLKSIYTMYANPVVNQIKAQEEL